MGSIGQDAAGEADDCLLLILFPSPLMDLACLLAFRLGKSRSISSFGGSPFVWSFVLSFVYSLVCRPAVLHHHARNQSLVSAAAGRAPGRDGNWWRAADRRKEGGESGLGTRETGLVIILRRERQAIRHPQERNVGWAQHSSSLSRRANTPGHGQAATMITPYISDICSKFYITREDLMSQKTAQGKPNQSNWAFQVLVAQ